MELRPLPQQITKNHLSRLAIVYVRQSSERQVEVNSGSTAAQRAQRDWALSWGWSEDQVHVYDDDLGLSGTATQHRAGYLRLREEIRAKRVGIVLVTDLSRLGREAAELFEFLKLCGNTRTLIATDGQIHDTSDSAAMFMQRVLSTVADFENSQRRDAMMRGRLAKLNAGKAVSRPPAGYIDIGDGQWAKDPDEKVQLAIQSIFEGYLRYRSLRMTAVYLRTNGVKIPRTRRRSLIEWTEPHTSTISVILKNRAYAGDYVSGIWTADPLLPRLRNGRARSRRNDLEDRRIVRGHHPAYVTLEQWEEIRAIADRHRRAVAGCHDPRESGDVV